MLRTTTRKAKDNIRKYIIDHAPEEMTENGEDFAAVARAIFDRFKEEKSGEYYKRFPELEVFTDWAQGLACDGLFLYYYNTPAIDAIGDILEETQEERERYTEDQAEERLTWLIYREIKSALRH